MALMLALTQELRARDNSHVREGKIRLEGQDKRRKADALIIGKDDIQVRQSSS